MLTGDWNSTHGYSTAQLDGFGIKTSVQSGLEAQDPLNPKTCVEGAGIACARISFITGHL